MAWSESRPNLTKRSSYHNVSKILVALESNVSSQLNSDLVVRLCFSVTITTQEEGHQPFPFIICKACVYKKSVKNELKVHTIWADDSSPGCSAKWHSSKDDVCWVFIIIRVEVAVLFTAFFVWQRSSTSFWYLRNVSYDTSVNFKESYLFSKCSSPT